MVDGVAVETALDRISTDGASLSFSPLATTDGGSYTCTLTITVSQTRGMIMGERRSAAKNIYIKGIHFVQKLFVNFFTTLRSPRSQSNHQLE